MTNQNQHTQMNWFDMMLIILEQVSAWTLRCPAKNGQCKAKTKPKLWFITTQPINAGMVDPRLGAEMFVESSAMDSAAYLIFHALVHQYD
jgi:hypothetical protein